MLNKNLFVSKMKLYGDTQQMLGEYLGLSTQRVNAKINATDGAEFTPTEMKKIKVKYNLTDEEFLAIFFVSDVS